jgi:hypothetical protein
LAFFTQNKAKLCKILIVTLVFEKNGIFFTENCQKSHKIVIIQPQGDRIVLNFAILFWAFLEQYRSSQHFGATFFREKKLGDDFYKNGLGYFGGDFFQTRLVNPALGGRSNRNIHLFLAIYYILITFGMFRIRLVFSPYFWYVVPRNIWRHWLKGHTYLYHRTLPWHLLHLHHLRRGHRRHLCLRGGPSGLLDWCRLGSG